jgi:hypothetical protein
MPAASTAADRQAEALWISHRQRQSRMPERLQRKQCRHSPSKPQTEPRTSTAAEGDSPIRERQPVLDLTDGEGSHIDLEAVGRRPAYDQPWVLRVRSTSVRLGWVFTFGIALSFRRRRAPPGLSR